jgi:hypothetical protein
VNYPASGARDVMAAESVPAPDISPFALEIPEDVDGTQIESLRCASAEACRFLHAYDRRLTSTAAGQKSLNANF